MSHDGSVEVLLLGFDPGRDKCGVAVVSSQGQLHFKEVVSAADVIFQLQSLCETYRIDTLILGNQTTSQQWTQTLRQHFPELRIHQIDERHSSLEARQRYWDFHPPRGWNRILPQGLRVPPDPYDDIVALILVERYLAQCYAQSS